MWVIVLPGPCYTAYRLVTFVLSGAGFQLQSAKDVSVTGNHVVLREEILSALGLPALGPPPVPVNLFRMSLDAKRAKIEAISWVRSAVLSRSYPHRLDVMITERAPVGFVNVDSRLQLVDGDGALLEKPDKGDFDFPVLSGVGADISDSERRRRLIVYAEFMRQLAPLGPRSGWSISEVDLSDPDDLKALLVNNQKTVRAYFGSSNFSDRFESFLALLPEVRKTTTRIDSVDLRYRNQIVVNPGIGNGEQVTGNSPL